MRRIALVSLLFLASACGAGYWAYVQFSAPAVNPIAPCLDLHSQDPADAELSFRSPVPNNRGPEVVDGFRGESHPFLHREAQTEVTAYWVPPKVDRLDPDIPLEVSRLYREVKVSSPTRSYSEQDFTPFLPPGKVKNVGQLWSIDPQKFAAFLTQFHPAVSTNSASVGRRPGPDGAFAMLRGVSDSHVDIVFRVHAEFDLLPKPSNLPIRRAWYSPACFLGRLVVNRQAGTVEYFQLGVPIEKATNVHTTMWIIDGLNGGHFHNMHRVDRMELIGGKLQGLDEIRWAGQIDMGQAHDKLAKVFYKFKEIDFLPFEKTLAASREQKKPIFAVVLLGALDDQGC